MADYSKEKVPDLKKLLQERGLAISGNKADLIARLQEDDSKKAGGGAAGKLFPLYCHWHSHPIPSQLTSPSPTILVPRRPHQALHNT